MMYFCPKIRNNRTYNDYRNRAAERAAVDLARAASAQYPHYLVASPWNSPSMNPFWAAAAVAQGIPSINMAYPQPHLAHIPHLPPEPMGATVLPGSHISPSGSHQGSANSFNEYILINI